MIQFRAGEDLAAAIENVLAGEDVRCAVAFWGRGVEVLIRSVNRRPRIICDVTLGGTSPELLRALGAPTNACLRCIPRFHAKIYLSDRGAVIGSANASRNGLGIDRPPSLIEGGVQLGPDENAYCEAARWFETQWLLSEQVSESSVDLATTRFRPQGGYSQRQVRPGSLLDLIAADPDRFSDVSVVLTGFSATDAVVDRVRATVKAANPEEGDAIDALPNSGMFTGWETQELNRWRRMFIELWMPRKRLFVYGRRVAYFSDSEGAVMSRADWPSIKKTVGIELPTRDHISEIDSQAVRLLLDEHGPKLFSSGELAAELERQLDRFGRI